MDEDLCVTLEIDDDGRGHLMFQFPVGTPDDEVAYFKSLVLREKLGSMELLDPLTEEVVYFVRPALLH
jgi:hypothetical protein